MELSERRVNESLDRLLDLIRSAVDVAAIRLSSNARAGAIDLQTGARWSRLTELPIVAVDWMAGELRARAGMRPRSLIGYLRFEPGRELSAQVGRELASAREHLRIQGLVLTDRPEPPPGPVRLRVLIHDTEAGFEAILERC